ncbi:hypothetical protein LINPERHAP2_LOCUS15955 [Linum perenne]
MQEDEVNNPRCPRIKFSEDEVTSFYKPWSKALVVRVLEKAFSFLTVKRRLESLWAKTGRIQVTDMANDFFLVRFSDMKDYQRAAFDGPWKVAVTRIGNYIGRTVRLDLATTEGARARYARVCVEIDISRPLLGKYIIDNRILLVEYESLENICYSCGFYGHKTDRCIPQSTDSFVPAVPEKGTAVSINEKDAGEWMTVCRRNGKRGTKSITTSPSEVRSGSRFNILKEPRLVPPVIHNTEPLAAPTTMPTTNGPSSVLAEHLKQVLEEALAKEDMTNPTQNSEGERTKPLQEVTNTPRNGKDKHPPSGKENSSKITLQTYSGNGNGNLVSVPVAYFNPIFQSTPEDRSRTPMSLQKPKTAPPKAKSGGGSKKAINQVKKTATKPIRKLNPIPSSPANNVSTSETIPKAGKPPDPPAQ